MTKVLKPLNIKDIEEEYAPEFDIFTEEGNLTYQIKKIIFEDLDIVERRIILLYAEKKSMREVGKQLGISTSKTHQIITDIRNKVISKLSDTHRKPKVLSDTRKVQEETEVNNTLTKGL